MAFSAEDEDILGMFSAKMIVIVVMYFEVLSMNPPDLAMPIRTFKSPSPYGLPMRSLEIFPIVHTPLPVSDLRPGVAHVPGVDVSRRAATVTEQSALEVLPPMLLDAEILARRTPLPVVLCLTVAVLAENLLLQRLRDWSEIRICHWLAK
jgi:hypothetical protein